MRRKSATHVFDLEHEQLLIKIKKQGIPCPSTTTWQLNHWYWSVTKQSAIEHLLRLAMVTALL
jgi:hypothetical protein